MAHEAYADLAIGYLIADVPAVYRAADGSFILDGTACEDLTEFLVDVARKVGGVLALYGDDEDKDDLVHFIVLPTPGDSIADKHGGALVSWLLSRAGELEALGDRLRSVGFAVDAPRITALLSIG